jgi:hypothetical protein
LEGVEKNGGVICCLNDAKLMSDLENLLKPLDLGVTNAIYLCISIG